MSNTLELVLEKKKTDFINTLKSVSEFKNKVEDDTFKDTKDNIRLSLELGFVNSKCIVEQSKIIQENLSFNQSVQRACECLKFIQEVSECFGPGTMVIKLEDLIEIMKKYNLVCGEFKNYTGVVPEENIIEIRSAISKVNSVKDGKYHYKYPTLSECYEGKYLKIITDITMRVTSDRVLRLGRNIKRSLKSFPITILSSNSGYYSDTLIKDFLKNFYKESEINKISRFDYHPFGDNMLFIIAPKNYMNNANQKLRFRSRPKTDDPFICSLTKYGVVIHSKWGKEAEDKTFEKYSRLFNNLKI